ncbi:MAG: PRC-barrel domain-containing protein [Hyphomicrobiales bacterium]|nr:PRC-barrel domain-containing protein [Hyphomicrobiales bacterium]
MGSVAKTSTLIAAEQVQGAPVHDRTGHSLGSIDDLVIDRNAGNIAYAVVAVGGFLSFGSRYFALPWSAMEYDSDLHGYVVKLDREQLEAAPAYGRWL